MPRARSFLLGALGVLVVAALTVVALTALAGNPGDGGSDRAPSEEESALSGQEPSPSDQESSPGDDQADGEDAANDEAPDDSVAAEGPGANPRPRNPTTDRSEREVSPEPRELPPYLVEHLEGLLGADDVVEVDDLSVAILDVNGHPVATLDEDRAVMPASTQKLVTAAAALKVLGPEHRYVTRILADGEVDDDGVLDGDLVLVGGGDPALATEVYRDSVYPQRPHTPIEPLVDAVLDAGISEITGAVRGNPQLYASEPEAAGWRERYFASLDATYASGLTVDAGRRIVERDGNIVGEPAEDPAENAAGVVDELLEEEDVETGEDPGISEDEASGSELGRVRSPELRELLVHVVQASDNHMADGVFRSIGAVTGDPTWEGSATATQDALGDLEVDWSDAVLADGSGLSREDRLPAELLAELDRWMMQEDPDEWRPLLATAGESGTLERRLVGTPAEGQVHAKTGSLRDVRALAGHVDSLEGERYHFAIVGADLEGPGVPAIRRLHDELALALVDPPDCPARDHPGTCEDPEEDDDGDEGEGD